MRNVLTLSHRRSMRWQGTVAPTRPSLSRVTQVPNIDTTARMVFLHPTKVPLYYRYTWYSIIPHMIYIHLNLISWGLIAQTWQLPLVNHPRACFPMDEYPNSRLPAHELYKKEGCHSNVSASKLPYALLHSHVLLQPLPWKVFSPQPWLRPSLALLRFLLLLSAATSLPARLQYALLPSNYLETRFPTAASLSTVFMLLKSKKLLPKSVTRHLQQKRPR